MLTNTIYFLFYTTLSFIHRVMANHETEKADDKKSYAWESTQLRSWEQIEEDPVTGRLKSYNKEEQIARKRQRDDGLRNVRRGIVRFCVLVLDNSDCMRLNDIKPTRAGMVTAACMEFIREFFDQNPISQLAIVVTNDDVAERLSPLSSNRSMHEEAVRKVRTMSPSGNASLQNTADLVSTMLSPVPSYGMREMVVILGALSSCDPGDLFASIDTLATERIRCSAIGLSAELHVLRVMTSKTKGTYSIAQNEFHFEELLATHVSPPPTTAKQTSASLIRMGFPKLKHLKEPRRFVNNPNSSQKLGYECTRCSVWISDVPSECPLCSLILVSSPHLARSYHHLFPVAKYLPVEENDTAATIREPFTKCYGCLKALESNSELLLICPTCNNYFCNECDIFVHDSLHHCPGCL